jgi:hypothetical protein
MPVRGTFEELFELALSFLGNPMNLLESGRFEHGQLVLRMAFGDRLAYAAKTGFRTPKTTLPFNILGDVRAGVGFMAERGTGTVRLFLGLWRFDAPLQLRQADSEP